MGVFFSCKHFPQTSLCATRRSECSGALSLRFDNKACDTTIFVILRHAAIHTRNPHKTHSVSMRPLCEILLDDCSIKATSCDVEFFFQRIPLVDLGVGWPFHSRFCSKARGGCYTAALSRGICQPGSEHRAPFLTQRSQRQTASPQVYLGLSAAVPHLTKAFARAVIGRSVC